MQIQLITNQPNFEGKLVFKQGTTQIVSDISDLLLSKYKTISKMVEKKPYDIFVSQNKQDPQFYDIAANTSYKKAQKVKEYTVKVQADIITTSIVDAAKEAMEMYEKYISKGIKG